jgi:hypothetical protein
MTLTHAGSELSTTDDPNAALPAVVDNLIRLGWQLDVQHVPEDTWTQTLRVLYQASQLNGYGLVAVAGGQGSGKTTLVSNLYPDVDEWLEPNPGRGEKNPVIIVETAEATEAGEPRGVVVRRDRKTDAIVSDPYHSDAIGAWREVVRGDRLDVLMVRLEVPFSFFQRDRTGFILLPGFERLDGSHWQTLMRVVLATSPAAIVVTDAERLADGMQQRIVQDLRAGSGPDRPPADVVIALSRCDGKDTQTVGALVDQAAEVYEVRPELIIPVGPDQDDPVDWKDRLWQVVESMVPSANLARRNEADLLRKVVRDDLAEVITRARRACDKTALDTGTQMRLIEEVMQAYDQQVEVLIEQLDTVLERFFGENGRLGAAGRRLSTALGEDGRSEYLRRAGDFWRVDPKGRDRRLLEQVSEAWQPAAAMREQAQALDQVADTMLDLHPIPPMVAAGSLAALDRLAQASRAEQDSVIAAVRMLPAMALRARAFTVGYADASGRINLPSEGDLATAFAAFQTDRQIFLGATALFLGADVKDGKLDSPEAVASAIHKLFTTFGEKAAARAAAKAAAGAAAEAAAVAAAAGAGAGAAAGVAAGEAAAGGAGAAAAGAAVVVPVLMVAVAAGATGAAIMRAANRAMKERGRLGDDVLREYRTATVTNALDSVAELLRLTREVLLRRLQYSLRVDDVPIRRLRMLQTIVETERAREQVLRSLVGRYVA